ncbi:MAG: PAS domain-containing protein, partial [Candidatus Bathyarchaeota archaeon]|nr:PAS domain-containing protein [Candidatus Bathyarchaeota archaeon]
MLKNKTNIKQTMDQEQITLITKALRNNPRGMTVTQISKEIDLNRNSVAKYLEVLLISGHVEMKSYGPAKVFYISQRVPMSTMLDFSSDYILILDRDLKIIQINNNFANLIKTKKNAIIGHRIEDIPIQIFKTPEMATKLKDTLDGKGTTQKIELTANKQKHYFNIKLISTTFEDGLPGVTIILENTTEIKKLEKTLQETKQLNQTLLQNMSDSVIVLDQKQTITSANNAACDLLQTPKEKIQQ